MTFYTKILKKFNDDQFLVDSSWTVFGSSVGKGLTFIGLLFVAKNLGSTLYGVNTFFKSTIETISFIALFGIHITITTLIANYKNKNEIKNAVSSVTFFIISVCFIFSIFYSLMIYDIVANYFNNFFLGYLLILIGSLSLSLNYFYNGVFAGLGFFKKNSVIHLISGILNISFLPLVAIYFSIKGVLIGVVCLFLFTSFLYILYLKKEKILFLTNHNQSLIPIFKISFPIGLQEICFPIYSWGLNFSIIYFLGNNFLGIYSTVISFYIMALFVPGILRNVLLRHLSVKNDSDNQFSKTSVFKNSILINLISTIVPLIFLNLFSSSLLIFFGVSFEGIEQLIFPVTIMTLVASVANPYYQIYISNNLNWRLFYLRLVKDLFSFLIILLVLIKYNNQSIDVLRNLIYIASLSSFIQLCFMYFDTQNKIR